MDVSSACAYISLADMVQVCNINKFRLTKAHTKQHRIFVNKNNSFLQIMHLSKILLSELKCSFLATNKKLRVLVIHGDLSTSRCVYYVLDQM